MGQNSIAETATSGIQYLSQPYETFSKGVIFVAAYSDMGMLVPIVYAFSETSSGWINISYSSNLHFLSNGRQPVDVSGGISTAANGLSIGFTWSDGNDVYSNHGYFDVNTRTIEANIIATEVVSSYNPQFSGSTDPTISADGGAFSVAFPTLWNSTAVGPIHIVAETEVTSQATDLTIYMATDGLSGPEFSAPMLSKDISPATSTDGYLVAKQNDNIKLFEKTSGNWIKFKQFGNVGRSVSEYVTESGMIGSYSAPVGGTSLSEIKEFEAYDGTNFKMNNATVSSMISAHWESQSADSVFHEFWLGEIGVEDEILPIEISGSDRYEITLTKPFILNSKSVRISYNHTEKNVEIPLTLAAFDTSGNRIQQWTPQLHTSLRHANVMENYSEAISDFKTESLPLNEETSRIPVVLKLVAKDSTKIRWLQIGVDGFQGKKKQYNQDDTAPINRDIPDDFNLLSNYPNPFNPTTNIVYELPRQSDVTITVYNITGRVVAVYNEGLKPAGSHRITFNAGSLSSGIYIYKLQAGEFSSTKKMLLIK